MKRVCIECTFRTLETPEGFPLEARYVTIEAETRADAVRKCFARMPDQDLERLMAIYVLRDKSR